jgi:hypothetical protein
MVSVLALCDLYFLKRARIASARRGNQSRRQPPALPKHSLHSLPKSAFSSCRLTCLGHGRLAIALRENLKLVPPGAEWAGMIGGTGAPDKKSALMPEAHDTSVSSS